MKQQIPLAIVFILGITFMIQYFIPAEASQDLFDNTQKWLRVTSVFAIVLGIYSILMVHFHKIKRKAPNWPYSVVTIVGIFMMLILGFALRTPVDYRNAVQQVTQDEKIKEAIVKDLTSILTNINLSDFDKEKMKSTWGYADMNEFVNALGEELDGAREVALVLYDDAFIEIMDEYYGPELYPSYMALSNQVINATASNEDYIELKYLFNKASNNLTEENKEELSLLGIDDLNGFGASLSNKIEEDTPATIVLLQDVILNDIMQKYTSPEALMMPSFGVLLEKASLNEVSYVLGKIALNLDKNDIETFKTHWKIDLAKVVPVLPSTIRVIKVLKDANFTKIVDKYYVPSLTPFRFCFEWIQIPISATMFSLLAFYIASAAYRAFRARSAHATLLLVAALIVMLGQVSIGMYIPFVGKYWLDFVNWIMNVPNLAAKRGIGLGVGLGAMATSLKIILGIERSYLGGGG